MLFPEALPVIRHDHTGLLPGIGQYRHTLTAYDASYVALAETVGATLMTGDARLAAAPGRWAKIERFASTKSGGAGSARLVSGDHFRVGFGGGLDLSNVGQLCWVLAGVTGGTVGR